MQATKTNSNSITSVHNSDWATQYRCSKSVTSVFDGLRMQ